MAHCGPGCGFLRASSRAAGLVSSRPRSFLLLRHLLPSSGRPSPSAAVTASATVCCVARLPAAAAGLAACCRPAAAPAMVGSAMGGAAQGPVPPPGEGRPAGRSRDVTAARICVGPLSAARRLGSVGAKPWVAGCSCATVPLATREVAVGGSDRSGAALRTNSPSASCRLSFARVAPSVGLGGLKCSRRFTGACPAWTGWKRGGCGACTCSGCSAADAASSAAGSKRGGSGTGAACPKAAGGTLGVLPAAAAAPAAPAAPAGSRAAPAARSAASWSCRLRGAAGLAGVLPDGCNPSLQM